MGHVFQPFLYSQGFYLLPFSQHLHILLALQTSALDTIPAAVLPVSNAAVIRPLFLLNTLLPRTALASLDIPSWNWMCHSIYYPLDLMYFEADQGEMPDEHPLRQNFSIFPQIHYSLDTASARSPLFCLLIYLLLAYLHGPFPSWHPCIACIIE